MSMVERIQGEMVAAMKARDKERASVLRMVLSRMQLAEKEAGGELTGEQEMKVLAAEKKKRLQSAEAFAAVGRDDRAALEEAEAAVIEGYLPQAMGEDELAALVDEAIAATGAASIKDMGKVMSELMPRVAGRADGKMLSELVKQRLAG